MAGELGFLESLKPEWLRKLQRAVAPPSQAQEEPQPQPVKPVVPKPVAPPLPFLPPLQKKPAEVKVPAPASEREIMANIPPLSPAQEFAPPDIESPEFKKASALTPEEQKRAATFRAGVGHPIEALETLKSLGTVYGPMETGLNFISQLYGIPLTLAAELVGKPFGKSKEFGEAVAKATIYEPQTEAGQQLTGAAAYPFEVLNVAGEKAADVTREMTGSPVAATAVGTAVKGAPLIAGIRRPVTSLVKEALPKVEGVVKPAGKVLGSERGAIGSGMDAKISGLKNTPEAYEFGKTLSRDQAQALWEEYNRSLESLREVQKALESSTTPLTPEMKLRVQEISNQSFKNQMMKETVEGHIKGGKLEPISLTNEEVDAYFAKPVMQGVAHGPEATSVEELGRPGINYAVSKGKVSHLGKQVDLPTGADAVIARMPDNSIKVVATKPGLSFKDAEAKFGDMVKKTSEKAPAAVEEKSKLRIVNGVDEINKVGTRGSSGYFLTPDDKLIDVTSEFGGGTNDHVGIFALSEAGEVFGLSKENAAVLKDLSEKLIDPNISMDVLNEFGMKASDAMYGSFKNGFIRIRNFGREVTIDSQNIDTPTLKRLQDSYRNGKLDLGERGYWGDAEQLKYIQFTKDQFLSARDIKDLSRKPLSASIAEALKSERGSLASETQPKGWTYPLQTVIEQKMPNSAPAEQVKALVKGAGVKEDEIKWSGLDDFLKGKTKVSKAELIDYLKQNQVEIKEIVKGKIVKRFEVRTDPIRGIGVWDTQANGWRITPETPLASEKNFNYLAQRADELNVEVGGPTKFSQWQLPGGENYRELLLTLPERKPELVKNPAYGKYAGEREFVTPEELRGEELKLSQAYKSSHWEEPNVLAHVRFNDRIDPNGKKVLFIEEVQSDWHQAGREKGYKSLDVDKQIHDLMKGNDKDIKGYGNISQLPPDTLKRVSDRMHQIQLLKEQRMIGVPEAPFSKTWHEMAMRRMVMKAAAKGYDKIAWTTGEQQAGRYDLQKYISKVRVLNEGTNGYTLTIWDKDGQLMRGMGELTGIQADELPKYIGKDLAKKIIDEIPLDTRHDFSGLDLKVGGEGMKGFYDKIIPDYMNKFGKKWGAKVGETELKVPIGREEQILTHTYGVKPTKVHSLDITPSMKKSVIEEGLPLFQLAPGVGIGAGLAGERLLRKEQSAEKTEKPAQIAPQYQSLEDVQEAVRLGALTRRYATIIARQNEWVQ